MNKPSNHITNLKCFEQVASVIGRGKAQLELFKARKAIINPSGVLIDCMGWGDTPQGFDFWNDIDDGINPYEH